MASAPKLEEGLGIEMQLQAPEIIPGQDDDDRDPTLCNMQVDGKFICTNLIDSHRDCVGGSDGLCKSCREKQTFFQALVQKLASEDTSQLLAVILSFLMQLYQMSVGSLIILFTPQLCVDHACTLKENFEVDYPFYLVVLITNFSTFAFMLTMYILELVREDVLISTMDVDENCNNDGDDVAKRMMLLSKHEKKHLTDLCWWYKYTYFTSLLLFLVNAIFSLTVVQKYSIGSQTDTAFTTNVLFMVKKLMDVYYTVSAEDNVFYSAYLLAKVQFNNVDATILIRNKDDGKVESTTSAKFLKRSKLNKKLKN